MPQPSAEQPQPEPAARARTVHEVTAEQLPVHCPLPEESLWNAHPRVYIPLERPGERRICPYCGTAFVLKG